VSNEEAAESLVEVEDIDMSFVPTKNEGIGEVELDGETLLIDSGSGTVHVLDPVGSAVWACFDGVTDLGTLVADLADAFNASPEIVEQDVLAMAKRLGASGLLSGVAPPRMVMSTPQGLEVGEALPSFELELLTGEPSSVKALGGQVLLVNWSPSCGYCVKIAPTLAEHQAKLAENGVTLAFITSGPADANRELFDTHGLTGPAFMRESAPDEFDDPFPSMGTPVAYLVDEAGAVAAPIAYGADAVPQLIRSAAGVEEPEPAADAHDHDHDHEHDHEDEKAESGPRYIPVSGGVCGPGASGNKKPRVWAATSAYAVGEYHIGVRADSVATDELLGRVFAEYRLEEGTEAPDNFSVVLSDQTKPGSRSLNLLLSGNATVVRSRSARRVITGLANYLSTIGEEPTDELLRVDCVGAIVGDEALLLPSVVRTWLEQLQPKLTRQGIRLVDTPFATIDPAAAELVVPEPLIVPDARVLAELPEPSLGRSELPGVEAGRYPLRAWALWHAGDREPSRGQSLAAAVSAVFDVEDLAAFVPTFSEVLDRLMPIPLVYSSADEMADALKTNLALVG
jgi:thiol-disulfide isomerase/thioredoxin